MSARNLIYSLMVCAVLLSPAILYFSQSVLRAELPSWLTGKDAVYLTGTSKTGSDGPEAIFFQAFISGSMQESIEDRIESYIPFKSAALLADAGIQQSFISMSNDIFGWECYPAFYGADHVYYPKECRLQIMPTARSEYDLEGLGQFMNGVLEAATKHPSTEFIIYLVGGRDFPVFSAQYDLISDSMPFSEVRQYMEAYGKKMNNVEVLASEYDDSDEYAADFFKSDHHWNIKGALRAYSQIAESLDLTLEYPSDASLVYLSEEYEGLKFTGSYARSARLLVEDEPVDIDYDFSGIQAMKYDGTPIDLNEHAGFLAANDLARKFDFHTQYFADLEHVKIKGSGDKSILLLSDSYGFAITRLLGTASEEFEANYPFLGHKKDSTIFAELEETDSFPNAVIFMAYPLDYSTFLDANPNFFVQNR